MVDVHLCWDDGGPEALKAGSEAAQAYRLPPCRCARVPDLLGRGPGSQPHALSLLFVLLSQDGWTTIGMQMYDFIHRNSCSRVSSYQILGVAAEEGLET